MPLGHAVAHVSLARKVLLVHLVQLLRKNVDLFDICFCPPPNRNFLINASPNKEHMLTKITLRATLAW
jgi:hypothetical protein